MHFDELKNKIKFCENLEEKKKMNKMLSRDIY